MYPRIKRLLDSIVAGIGLVVACPLILIIAMAIRLTMGSPILFRQRRPGFRERMFECIKFRTMTDECDQEGKLLSDAKRTTRLGLFLRRTSLDELPQLFSILRGDLSIIGPRPLLECYLDYYRPVEHRRHDVRPGLTGWAQIHGRNNLSFDQRLAMDVWYVDHMSWTLDLRIFLATVWIVLTQKGFGFDTKMLSDERAAMKSGRP
jgi:sugar transferase EpsL